MNMGDYKMIVMDIILFDPPNCDHLLPFTFTRPACDIRLGILTIREKWASIWPNANWSIKTKGYLPFKVDAPDDSLYINACVLPNAVLVEQIEALQLGESLVDGEVLIAHKGKISDNSNSKKAIKEYQKITYPWDIFQMNAQAIKDDFEMLTKGKTSQAIHDSNFVVNPENIFIEEGATVLCTSLNASEGPIYIGKNATVMECSAIRGPFALCDHGTVKMSAKIYGSTTIGPHSKVGGEISNSVIFGYSNKGHDGYLGNAVLGEWCNLGADTNNSNLKNNYSPVKIWNYPQQSYISTGTIFCGLFMGDHSKCGINTMFNTGTVVGVSANIYGGGFQKKLIPSFSWGADAVYDLEKAMATAKTVMARRKIEFSEADELVFRTLFDEL